MKVMIRMLLIVTLSSLIFISLVSFKFSLRKVNEYTMTPTLRENDLALFDKNTENIKRFDIVLIKQNSTYSIRRIIGLPGETVRYTEDVLYVDEKEQPENFIRNEISESELYGGFFTKNFSLYSISKKSTISENEYLVLCDNRFIENDSRTYGLVNHSAIKGVLKSNFHVTG